MPDIRIDVYSDQHGAPQELKQTEDALAGVERQGGETDGALGKLWKQFAIGSLVAQGAGKIARAFTNELISTVSAAIESERADRALTSALQITGQTAGGAAKHFKNYATELQKKTLYDDEAIKSGQALMIQMGLSVSKVDEATRAAIGLATVYGIDLESAARAVAQGLQGNYRALGQLIPSIRNATTDGDKHAAMVEAMAKAYKRAEDEVGTYGGKITQLKDQWVELKEIVGKVITDNVAINNYLKDQTTYLQSLNKESKESAWSLKNIIAAIASGSPQIAGAIATAGATVAEAGKIAEDGLGGMSIGILKFRRLLIEPIPITQLEVLKTTIKLLNTEIDAMPWGRHRAEMEVAAKQLFEITTVVEGQLPVIAGYSSAVDTAARRIKLLRDELDRINKTPPTWAEKWEKAMVKITAYTDAAFSGLDAIFSQSQTNREIAIENEYKKRLAFINKNITDEDARQKAVMALEAEYQIKKSEARAKGAKAAKAVALMEAIVNTASAITDALPNLILAAIVAAMGAVQIGVIAAQPIPLARGGVFTKRTRLTSDAGTAYEVGEGGEAEILAPGSAISKAVREGGGGGGYSITINGPMIATTAALTEEMCRRAASWMFAAVDGEARRRGGRLINA